MAFTLDNTFPSWINNKSPLIPLLETINNTTRIILTDPDFDQDELPNITKLTAYFMANNNHQITFIETSLELFAKAIIPDNSLSAMKG